MWLFLAFLAVPLIEIALFIQVGGALGLFPTLAIVVLTAILGTYLVRAQGAMALGQLRGSLNSFSDPTEPLAHGAMILFSGALLLTPGFFTDAMGFLLLIPAFRSRAFQYLRSKVKVQSFGTPPPHPQHPRGYGENTVEGTFEEVEPTRPPSDKPSGWTRH